MDRQRSKALTPTPLRVGSLTWVGLLALSACVAPSGGGDADGGRQVRDGGTGDGGVATCPEDTGLRPPPRAEAFGGFDPVRRTLWIFGGDDGAPVQCNPSPHPIGDLWRYDVDCGVFEEVTLDAGAPAPGGRARGFSVYDPAGDRLIVYGGRYRSGHRGRYTVYGDVWALDLASATWTRLDGAGGPSPTPRSSPAGGLDETRGEIVIFGGNASDSGLTFAPLGDTWAFSLADGTWRPIETGAGPAPRLLHAAAVDGAGGRLFVYGGTKSFFADFMADLWVLDMASGTWTELHDGSGAGSGDVPLGRIWSNLLYDAPRDRLLLFGGHDAGAVGNNNDLWAFDLATGTWSNLIPPESVQTPAHGFCDFPPDFTQPNLEVPERRSAALMALDGRRGEWLVYAGKTDCGIIDDLWVLDPAAEAFSRLLGASSGEGCLRGENPDLCVALCQ